MAKIMVVDDAYFVRIKVKNFLEAQGYAVIEADNGKTALDAYELEKPDLVFCDITMPEMDGVAFLKAVREKHPEANVVMLTSLGEQSILMQALAAGAKNFLMKPFDDEKTIEVIKSIIG